MKTNLKENYLQFKIRVRSASNFLNVSTEDVLIPFQNRRGSRKSSPTGKVSIVPDPDQGKLADMHSRSKREQLNKQ